MYQSSMKLSSHVRTTTTDCPLAQEKVVH